MTAVLTNLFLTRPDSSLHVSANFSQFNPEKTILKSLKYFLLAIIACISVGCTTLQSIADNAPAAETPSTPSVSAILTKGGSWTTVGINANREYEILPGGLPSGGIHLYFYAPYPSTLKVGIDGINLPKLEDIPQGTSPATTGFYKIVDINVNLSSPYWTIVVRPPARVLPTNRYVIGISDVSINPKFRDSAGNSQVSSPLLITAVTRLSNELSILFPGSGHGNVSVVTTNTPTPTNTYCDSDCNIDFGQSVTVRLEAHPSGNQSFTGWSGACTGSSSVCTIFMNGKATAVAATFARSANSGTADSCPPLASVPGYTYFNKPACDSQNAYHDPAPALRCNAIGYFCCANATGANGAECGIDHVKFPATCHLYGNPKVKMEPSGCYLQN
jgi:hypothetical protein